MIQTGLIPNAHNDLVTDASYDFYGLRLATCSLDQRIKIWELDETNNWNVEDDWKAHDAAISKLSWAHPEFGSIIASASFDRTVKIWEQVSIPESEHHQSGGNTGSQAYLSGSSRWVERAILSDAKGTVRSVEFCPHYFGLKLATIATDNTLRIYDCVEQPSLTSWQLTEEFDVQTTPPPPQQLGYLNSQTLGIATPTQTYATATAAAGAVGEIGASASLVTQALQQQQQQQQSVAAATAAQRQQLGNREADGGWCLSWCKDKYWGEVIVVGCGTSGVVKIVQINARRSTTLLSLPSSSNTAITTTTRPPPSPQLPTSTAPPATTTTGLTVLPLSEISQTEQRPPATPSPPPTNAITSVAWAPSCGRSYHLIATGGRDGHVRIWKVKPGNDGFYGGVGSSENTDGEDDTNSVGEDEDDPKWTATVVADFDQHRSSVGRVEWNITGTVLSSAGNDGRVRLWKATVGNVWRSAGSLGVEQTDETSPGGEKKDVEMET